MFVCFVSLNFLAIQCNACSKNYTRDVCAMPFLLSVIPCNTGSKKYARDVFVLCHFYFQRSHVTWVVKSTPVMFVCLGILTLNDPTAL